MSSPNHSTFDSAADAAYWRLGGPVEPGAAVEQVVIERDGGSVVLDFDAQGRLLGVEVIGARRLLRPTALAGLRAP